MMGDPARFERRRMTEHICDDWMPGIAYASLSQRTVEQIGREPSNDDIAFAWPADKPLPAAGDTLRLPAVPNESLPPVIYEVVVVVEQAEIAISTDDGLRWGLAPLVVATNGRVDIAEHFRNPVVYLRDADGQLKKCEP